MAIDNPDQAGPGGPRRSYEKPQVTRVSLRPEEAVLGACKVSGIAGPTGLDCGGGTACNVQNS